MRSVKRATVIGASEAGCRIAAMLAGWEIPVLFLDLKPGEAERAAGIVAAKCTGLLRVPNRIRFIQPGRIDDHAALISHSDLVFEACSPALEEKGRVYSLVAPRLKEDCLVCSLHCGHSLSGLDPHVPGVVKTRFFRLAFPFPMGVHSCVEVVASPSSSPQAAERLKDIFGRVLGILAVQVKDSRISVADRMEACLLEHALGMLSRGEARVEEIDFIAGLLLGRGQFACFRHADLRGLPEMQRLMAEAGFKSGLGSLALLESMVSSGLSGTFSGSGFYSRQNGAVLSFRPANKGYEPVERSSMAELTPVFGLGERRERYKALASGTGRAFDLSRSLLGAMLRSSAANFPQCCFRMTDFDAIQRDGCGWERGPFEIWDMMGTGAVLESLVDESFAAPPWLKRWMENHDSFHAARPGGMVCPTDAGEESFEARRSAWEILRVNDTPVAEGEGWALRDLGDGVLVFEMKDILGLIGTGMLESVRKALVAAAGRGAAVVLGRDGRDFCLGTDLREIVALLSSGKCDLLRTAVELRQSVALLLRSSQVPVVAACGGAVRGTGLEVALQCSAVVACADSVFGCTDLHLGVMPLCGTCAEIAARAAPDGDDGGVIERLIPVFDALVRGRLAGVDDARRLNFLRACDPLCRPRHTLLAAAKMEAIRQYNLGYQPRQENEPVFVTGSEGRACLEVHLARLEKAGLISPYQAGAGNLLAGVLTGGSLNRPCFVPRKYLLELEMEAFFRQLGRTDTLKRIHGAIVGPVQRESET